ncbi:MAG: tripartite tricarboxylate transporter substrate binding protein [Burkholderiales bacterium]|nr:tripartite tricarboxylate transporter substrate binding protein [Burkholderiales bacterium]
MMQTTHSSIVAFLALCALLALASADALAQAKPAPYPVKAIRYIVPFAPAGTGDVCARYHAQTLQERLGQPVVIENRAGANQVIGIEAAVKSAPDGYTILQGALSGLVLNTVFSAQSGQKLPYDAVRDLAPVSMLCTAPLYLAVHASRGVKSVKELVAYAKANPGKLTFSSNGVGGTQHLGVELFAYRMGLKFVHVPYKSGAQSTLDMVSGVVDMLFGGSLLIPHAKAGKVHIIATGSLQRTGALPEVPTFDESGLPGYDVSSWFAVMAPAGTPRPIIERLARETEAIVKATRAGQGHQNPDVEFQSSAPEELGKRIRDELATWTKVIKETGIKP